MRAEATTTEGLRRLIKTDPDPRVRQRAQAVLMVEQGHTLASVGRLLEMKPDRVRIWHWQRRFARQGRQGLLDRARRGRPPALDVGDHQRSTSRRARSWKWRWSRGRRRTGCR